MPLGRTRGAGVAAGLAGRGVGVGFCAAAGALSSAMATVAANKRFTLIMANLLFYRSPFRALEA